MLRGPLYGVDRMSSATIGSYQAANVPVLDIHEIVAGKMVALVTRRTARDLFDAHRIIADEIWTVNPMPMEGFSPEELAAVDLAQGEERMGPGGETLRKMIRKTYHCKSRKEVDHFLRRWIAS
jgi:Nucleotidyl transferase AbiEii toxin, Type IV TA system